SLTKVCAAKAELEVSAAKITAERVDFFIINLVIQGAESHRAFMPVLNKGSILRLCPILEAGVGSMLPEPRGDSGNIKAG
ncbi:hypothetical protein OFN51_33860, partial [Escherichia coli]|nr:hypothetical protein [Escherichia coli]